MAIFYRNKEILYMFLSPFPIEQLYNPNDIKEVIHYNPLI